MLINTIQSKYNISAADVNFLFRNIDSKTGLCSYADACNMIFLEYMNRPIDFKNTFGYDI